MVVSYLRRAASSALTAACAFSSCDVVPANFCSMTATRLGNSATSSCRRRISLSVFCSFSRFSISGSIGGCIDSSMRWKAACGLLARAHPCLGVPEKGSTGEGTLGPHPSSSISVAGFPRACYRVTATSEAAARVGNPVRLKRFVKHSRPETPLRESVQQVHPLSGAES